VPDGIPARLSGAITSESRSDSRPDYKHRIRKAIHPQLKELWNQNDDLRSATPRYENNWQRCGFRFIPLVNQRKFRHCSLDILFLRRDQPGNLIRHGGDIDNRLKVLFDGLRIPERCDELPKNCKPEPIEDPFFCLLEDDELITQVKVTTDRLFIAPTEHERLHNVVLVIRVNASVFGLEDYIVSGP
jgi:hypothetical protein